MNHPKESIHVSDDLRALVSLQSWTRIDRLDGAMSAASPDRVIDAARDFYWNAAETLAGALEGEPVTTPFSVYRLAEPSEDRP
jgi:hypothetical protein